MISIQQILDKLGIKSIGDLQPAERETFNQWQAIIAKPGVTIDDLKKRKKAAGRSKKSCLVSGR